MQSGPGPACCRMRERLPAWKDPKDVAKPWDSCCRVLGCHRHKDDAAFNAPQWVGLTTTTATTALPSRLTTYLLAIEPDASWRPHHDSQDHCAMLDDGSRHLDHLSLQSTAGNSLDGRFQNTLPQCGRGATPRFLQPTGDAIILVYHQSPACHWNEGRKALRSWADMWPYGRVGYPFKAHIIPSY